MSKTYTLDQKQLFSAETPEITSRFYEWAMRTNAVADEELIEFSDYLIFSNMNAETEKPPSFFLVGSRSASRAKLGDEWANTIHTTQHSPVKRLDEITAGGYLNALHFETNYDVVEIEDENIRTTYKRLIVPIRTKPNLKPMFFGMLLYFDEFFRLSSTQGDEGHLIENKKSKNHH